MNEVERAQRDILAALILAYHQSASYIPELVELLNQLHLSIPSYLVTSSISRWEEKGWLYVGRTKDAVCARIKDEFYADAHAQLLNYLGAGTFMVDWQRAEIITDAENYDWIPCGEGWKIFEIARRSDEPIQQAHSPTQPAPVINIHNNVSPNFIGFSSDDGTISRAAKSQARASWFSGWIAACALGVAITAIVASLWAAGKI